MGDHELFRTFWVSPRAIFNSRIEHVEFEAVHMPDGLDWLFRPCVEGLCKYESIVDGTLDLADIAIMNDLLDVKAENEYRHHRAAMRNG